jgi:hypothetical protein
MEVVRHLDDPNDPNQQLNDYQLSEAGNRWVVRDEPQYAVNGTRLTLPGQKMLILPTLLRVAYVFDPDWRTSEVIIRDMQKLHAITKRQLGSIQKLILVFFSIATSVLFGTKSTSSLISPPSFRSSPRGTTV